VESNNGKFGTMLKNGSWTGQIGALDKKEIDLSIMDLTIMHSRAKVCLNELIGQPWRHKTIPLSSSVKKILFVKK